jgi:type I restriction-modification system DNA methylase subunit
MASKYDDLDAYTELEQELTKDLSKALTSRGCNVVHHGANNGGRHSPGGKPDIEVRDPHNRRLMLVEVTKRRSSAADSEFLAITDHLQKAIDAGGYDDYCLLYVSPATSSRMSTNIRDLYNHGRERDGLPGRIVALDFGGTQLMLEKLAESDSALYPSERFGELFSRWTEAVDDARTRQLIQETLFPEDHKLALELEDEASQEDADKERDLKNDLAKIENQLRSDGVTGNLAHETLIYLAFMRLYEERRQQRNPADENRFSGTGFTKWKESAHAATRAKYDKRMVEALLHEIAEDPDLQAAGLLRDEHGNLDALHRNLTDRMVQERILPIFDQYDFHAGRVDILGAVFETLAQRAEKDTRIGQFFTPQQVVDFCAKIVELTPRDVVLDPAVGTARFLRTARPPRMPSALTG